MARLSLAQALAERASRGFRLARKDGLRSKSATIKRKVVKKPVTKKKQVSRLVKGRHASKKNQIRCITLCCAELAAAVLAKQKTIENRTWHPPRKYLDAAGRIWLGLHVGGQTGVYKTNGKSRPMPHIIRKHMLKAWKPEKASRPWNKMDLSKKRTGVPLPCGAIVGLIRVKCSRKLKRSERTVNPWAVGPICWEIDRAVKLDPPIENVNGALSLWSIDREPSISEYARRRLASALHEAKSNGHLGKIVPRDS